MIEILKVNKLKGRVEAPSSKSISQRVLLLSAFLPGHKKIGPISGCDDEKVALAICSGTGMRVLKDGRFYNIFGDPVMPKVLNAGESGTTLRLLLGLLAAKKWECEIQTEGRLIDRPLKPLIKTFENIGCKITIDNSTIYFNGTKSDYPSEIEVDSTESSQFTSSLLFYMALNPIEHKIIRINGKIASMGYIEMTTSILNEMGLNIKMEGNLIHVSGTLEKLDFRKNVEGDYSGASFIMAAGILLSKDKIEILNLNKNSLQPDREILNLLDENVYWNGNNLICKRGEVNKELVIDANKTPDLAPVIALIGMFSKNGCKIKNSSRLKGKESDRETAIIEIAESVGCHVEREDDTMEILSGEITGTPIIPVYRDHRIIMETVITLAMISQKFIVSGTEYLSKSFPEFVECLIQLGFERTNESTTNP